MVDVDFEDQFQKLFSRLDPAQKEKVRGRIRKIVQNPEIGKPMMYDRKGTRELYVRPFRLSYVYIKDQKIIFLDIYHKDEQ